MAERKTAEQKLAELDKKMEQLQARKKEISAKVSKEKRAERTRRLIEIGALSEKYFNCSNIEPKQFEMILQKLVQMDTVKAALSENESGVNG